LVFSLVFEIDLLEVGERFFVILLVVLFNALGHQLVVAELGRLGIGGELRVHRRRWNRLRHVGSGGLCRICGGGLSCIGRQRRRLSFPAASLRRDKRAATTALSAGEI